MSSDKKILFIVNPASGKLLGKPDDKMVLRFFKNTEFKCQLETTSHVGHASDLTLKAVAEGYSAVIAVGGDGTVNEIANTLNGTNCALGIIPCGSGNGLARTLKISTNHQEAIKSINSLNTVNIDVGFINEEKFINMAGMGFDAHISAHFSNSKKRGFINYIKSTLTEISAYKSQIYKITIGEKTIERVAFMLSVANSSQYGNNAYIAPNASLDDDFLDLCIIKPFPLYKFPLLAFQMFTKTIHKSKYVEIIKINSAMITREVEGPIHTDGEPLIKGKELSIKIKHLALKLIV